MSRGHSKIKKQQLSPDQKHGSVLVTKFINYIMERGKKSVAEKIVYSSVEKLADQTKLQPLDALDRVMKNVGPLLEIKAKRIGGANYQVPIEVSSIRKETLALRWIIDAAKKRKGAPENTPLHDLNYYTHQVHNTTTLNLSTNLPTRSVGITFG